MGCRILENDLKGMYFRQSVTLSMMKDRAKGGSALELHFNEKDF